MDFEQLYFSYNLPRLFKNYDCFIGFDPLTIQPGLAGLSIFLLYCATTNYPKAVTSPN